MFVRIAVGFIKLIMLIYDIISLPCYFLWQRPDRKRQAAYQLKSERVDDNTWIKTTRTTTNCLINSKIHRDMTHYDNGNAFYSFDKSVTLKSRAKYNFKGSTLNEIFANSIIEHSTRPCLGYRALITCPVVVYDKQGKQTLQEKSFRSDYTWYTYEQVGRRVQDIASGLYDHSIYPNTRALIFGDSSLEWFIAAHACFQLGIQLVLAPDISDVKILASILIEAKVESIFTSCAKLDLINRLFEYINRGTTECQTKELKEVIAVKKIVVIDWQFSIDFADEPVFSTMKQVTQNLVEAILPMGKIEERGVENPIELGCRLKSDNSDSQKLLSLMLPHKVNGDQNRSTLDDGPKYSNNNHGNDMPNSELRLRTRSRGSSYTNLSESFLNSNGANCVKWTTNNKRSTKLKSPEPDDLAMIVYSYGSMRKLKGVMLNHACLARCNHCSFLDGIIQDSDFHCAVLPLDNLFEFITEMCLFSRGASIGYSCGSETLFYDGSELTNKRDRCDLEALKPTFLATRPFMLERFRASINTFISEKMNPILSYLLINVIYDYKRYWAKNYYQTPLIDSLFCSRLRALLFGSRAKFILCHGATKCSETKDFFAFMVNIPIIELYGQSEAIVSMMSAIDVWDFHESNHGKKYDYIRERLLLHQVLGPQPDFQQIQLMPSTTNSNLTIKESSKNLLITSSVFCPTQYMRIRLEDWGDFRTTDLPYPRGRLIVGGDIVGRGYFNDRHQELTDKLFYEDSNFIRWFKTEDIAQALPNGTFEIISCMSDLIKMADGHFISLGQVEQILRNSQFVDNVCAICCEERKFLIALVVPNLRRLALKSPGADDIKMAIGIGGPEPDELNDIDLRREVCNDRLLCEFVNKHLSELVLKAGLQAIPKRFHLVAEIWTPDSELVTPSLKPSRRNIEKFYASEIETIFKTEFKQSSGERRHKLMMMKKNRPIM